VKGIGQMGEALDVLKSIALQQSSSSVHKVSLLNVGSEARSSLIAVSALVPQMESFLQGAGDSHHSAQGDAIVGILKKLQSTFEGNLKNARDSEAAEKKAFDETIKTLKASWDKMDKSNKEKQTESGENDGELSSKKTLLEEAQKQKASDEDFLEKLLEMAAKKAKNWEERKMLRANEDAAIAEAISILNSDDAFSTFGEVDATSTGKTASFLQLSQLRGGSARQQAEFLLRRAAAEGHSTRLARVATGLRTGHAFTVVLAEIEKMKETITKEGTSDKENFDWCKKERTNSNKDLDSKNANIKALNEAIDKLDETINDPKTGLKQQISEKEASLVENQKAQTDQTATRKEENAAYQKDVSDLTDAEDILGKAIKVLSRYYDQLDKHMKENKDSTNLLQEKAEPAPPKTYDDFEGQGKSGNEALTMLKFIKDETNKEHAKADSDEKSAQSDYDKSMAKLKKDETSMQKGLVKLNSDLTEKEKELEEKQTDLKDTTKAKEAIEAYLLKIKPGCDFITTNLKMRDTNRDTETKALNKAKGLIEGTAAYKDAVQKDKELAAGKCKKECRLDDSSLKCKVCVAGTTKHDFCKKNAGFAGCK